MKDIFIENIELSENDHPVRISFNHKMSSGYVDGENDHDLTNVMCKHCHSLNMKPEFRAWDNNSFIGYMADYILPRALISGGCEYEDYSIICLDCLLESLALNNLIPAPTPATRVP